MKRSCGFHVHVFSKEESELVLAILYSGRAEMWAWDSSGAKRGPFQVQPGQGRIDIQATSERDEEFVDSLLDQAPCEVELHFGGRVITALLTVSVDGSDGK